MMILNWWNYLLKKNNVADISSCDGFILTGGVDIHPSFYEGKENYPNQPNEFQIERDRFEKKIYDYSQQQQLPLLAICRGMQLVNVLEGGKLIHDLDESNTIHKKESEDKVHHINVTPGHLLHQITGKTFCDINSAHHQAIDPVFIGNNLLVNAVSEDDAVIEGIEFNEKKNKAFFLGVQWHPERMKDQEHPFSKNIKQRFLQEVRKIDMKKLVVINPATEEILAELNQDTKESVAQKLEQLGNGQQEWKKNLLN